MKINKLTLKRISALFIVICVLFASFNNFIPSIIAQDGEDSVEIAASQPNAKRYFGDQLGQESILVPEETKSYDPTRLSQFMTNEQTIYNTLEKMKADEIFQNGSIDCPVSGTIYSNDKGLLLQAFSKARDAFKNDNPDLFYVDFDELAISTDSKGIYIGIGPSNDYLLNGFTSENIPSEIAKYETKIEDIVSKAKVAKTNNSNDENIGIMNEITFVHDYIVENMMYKYENECTKGNNSLCNHRTAYDGLVNQEGVCEAYARTFKAVLDRLDIPTICVYGLYKAKDSFSEEHMWNYVYWNNAWYGVDVTHDDPVPRNTSKKDLLKTELENRDYFMVSETELNIHHLPSGVMTSIDYIPFAYPGISLESQETEKTLFNNDGLLKVKLNKSYYTEDIGDQAIPSGDVYVSYQGHSIGWNEKHGKYLVCKFSQYQPGTDTWTQMDWGYLTPELYPAIKEVENPQNPDKELGEGYTKLPMPHIGKIQFAITDIAPDLTEQGILNGGLYYKQDPYLLDSVSEVIENPWGTYIAPPYPKKTTPGLNGRLYIGRTYDIKLEYDDKLVPIDNEDFKIDIEVSAYYDGLNTALENCKLENPHFDGDKTITFKFTPSDMFNDDLVMYIFNIKGLKGLTSNKRPIPVSYVFAFGSNVGCSRVRAAGGEYYAYGQPKLLANEDVSKNLKVKSDGSNDFESIDERISHRLTLVAKQTSQNQGEELKEFVQNDQNVEVKSCQTYNIQLNLCKKQILQTGDKVKVCVGFPPNYSKNDIGTSFVAYHYITNERGEITDVEEIPCEVTEQGLVIWVNSFSPFMIAAIDKKDTPVEKSLIFDISEGGSAIVDGKTVGSSTSLKFDNNESKTVQISPDNGYKIDKIEVNGKEIAVNSGGNSQTINISSNDSSIFPDNTAINSAQLGVSFITNSAESHKQQRPEINNNINVNITDNGSNLTANVTGTSQAITYQWYKDEQPLKDKTTAQLDLTNDISKVGSYKVVAKVEDNTTSISGSASYNVAKPVENKQVIFNPNGGEFNLDKITTNEFYTDSLGNLSEGDLNKINANGVITRVGYSFIGWSTNSNNSVAEITDENLKNQKFSSDTILYAVWQKNSNENLLTLNLEKAKLNVKSSDLLNPTDEDELININNNVKYFVKNNNELSDNLGNIYKATPEAIRDGFSFKGWKTSDGQLVKNLNQLNNDTILTPSFDVYDNLGEDQDYDIVLNPDGGNLEFSLLTYELNKGDKLELPLPTKDSYYFAGWYVENDSNHVQPIGNIDLNDDFINLHYKLNNLETHSITLIAYWVPQNIFNVKVFPETLNNSVDSNSENNKPGHIMIVSQTSDGASVAIGVPKKGDVITYKAYPSEGYRFKGWYKNGELYNVSSQNLKESSVRELTVTFDPEEEILAVFEPINQNTQKEYKITLVDRVYSNNNDEIIVKDGKVPKLPKIKDEKFLGWFTSEIDGEKIEEGFPLISDLTLYAHYRSNEVKISSSVNPTNAGKVKGTGQYLPGTEIVLEAQANQGFKFDNWTLDGKVVSTDQYLTLITEKDAHYVANFSENEKLDPDHQFSLKEDTIYLTTQDEGTKEAEIKVIAEKPLVYEWSSSAPTVASITSIGPDSIKIQSIAEGICYITAKSGNVIKTAKIIVSNNGIVTNSIFAHSNSPDEITIEAHGVMANPALKEANEVKSLNVFAWSEPEQKDINAKQININENGNWSLTIPINQNDLNNHFIYADKVNIHIYAETDSGLELIGTTVYNYSNGDYLDDNYLIGTPYAQNIGFITPSVFDNSLIGTEGESRQLEGIRLACPIDGVSLTYSVHMADIGWSDEQAEGSYAGTMEQNRRLEAIKISLTGENAQNYSLQYQAHVADKGWLDWVDQGQVAGTEGECRQLEAIRVKIVKK